MERTITINAHMFPRVRASAARRKSPISTSERRREKERWERGGGGGGCGRARRRGGRRRARVRAAGAAPRARRGAASPAAPHQMAWQPPALLIQEGTRGRRARRGRRHADPRATDGGARAGCGTRGRAALQARTRAEAAAAAGQPGSACRRRPLRLCAPHARADAVLRFDPSCLDTSRRARCASEFPDGVGDCWHLSTNALRCSHPTPATVEMQRTADAYVVPDARRCRRTPASRAGHQSAGTPPSARRAR